MDLDTTLNAFDPNERRNALSTCFGLEAGSLPEATANFNMHMHSFFSFNAEDWSPSRIAWESRKRGLYAAGLCDFDVLDGVREFIDAGTVLGLRVAASLETRAYYDDYASVDICSPGEPGVTYIMAAGFVDKPAADSESGRGLQRLADNSTRRNIELIARVNPHLPDIAIDYENDVLTLTPKVGATERHIIRAYCNKSIEVFRDADRLQAFWADIFKMDGAATAAILASRPKWEDLVRARLVKSGGVGYEQPSEETFPPVRDFVKWALISDAIPMVTWLDGTSAGEADGRALLDNMKMIGCAALNIVPDRNWNIADPDQKAIKVANLRAIVAAADDLAMPINIGTEMNKQGLPFVDDLSGDVLSEQAASFTLGAQVMVGHTNLLHFANYGYLSEQAVSDYPDAAKRNDYFARVGALPAIGSSDAAELDEKSPSAVLDWFKSALA